MRSYTSVDSSKTTPDSRPKWTKCIPLFRLQRPKNLILWGCTYLYGLYKGVPPRPPNPRSTIMFISNFTDTSTHIFRPFRLFRQLIHRVVFNRKPLLDETLLLFFTIFSNNLFTMLKNMLVIREI